MAGTDKYRHSSSKRVKVIMCGQFPSFQSRHQVSYLLVLSLLRISEFNEKNIE